MKKKKGGFLIRSGLLLIVAAAVLSAYNVYDGFRAERNTNESMAYLESAILPQRGSDAGMDSGANGGAAMHIDPAESAGAASNVAFEIPADAAGVDSPEMQYTEDPIVVDIPREIEIPDYVLNPNMDMPSIRHKGQDYIGILEIPALELKLPVISEWNYPRLRISPCRYSGSVYTRDMVISAHNYAAHFGSLNKLYEGAAVRFTDADGNVFDYRVGLKETLNPRDVEYMKDSGWDMTLFTCTPGGSYRVTVRCELLKGI